VELPKSCEDIKNILGESAFVKLYQKIGTNLRMSGKPTEEQLVEGKFFTLAEKINVILKDIKKAATLLRRDKHANGAQAFSLH